MERREAIKSLTLALGYSLAPATLSGLVTSCAKENTETRQPVFFTSKEMYAVQQLAEVFLPKTDIPGATDLNIHVFIDEYMAAIPNQKDRDKCKVGVEAWISSFEKETEAQIIGSELSTFTKNVESYFKIDEKKQEEVKALIRGEEPASEKESYFIYSFLFTIKRLSILGYYASEEIGENVLSYLPVPGGYKGCIPVEEVGNAWSL
ncbi:MAG: gluconate 2-dehydrogenase subunit 3 family protein [Cyclobacteriaceae bacterium]|nr:gluconate 2-dehydrogenase subunit 3 family protein [Cyclobacteriaceae bacterium]